MSEKSMNVVGRGVNPPAVFGIMFGMLLLIRAFGVPSPLSKRARLTGIPMMLLGFLLGGTAARAHFKAGTTPNPNEPTTALVKSGPYRFTRNPIYLAMSVMYAGVAVLMNAIWSLLLLPGAILVLDRGMVRREEAYLENRFGEEYIAYKKQVHRWL